jgi:hypothetical protein
VKNATIDPLAGIKPAIPVQPGLEITFPTFPITVIGNHDFFPIK